MLRSLRYLALLVFLLTGCSFLGQADLFIERDVIVLDGNSTAVLTLRNRGGGDIRWTSTTDALWLSAVPSSGTLGPLASARVILSADKGFIPITQSVPIERQAETYAATLSVVSDVGEATAAVRLIVGEEPTSDLCQPFSPSRAGQDRGFVQHGFARHDDALRPAAAQPADQDRRPTHVLVQFREPPPGLGAARQGVGRDIAGQVAMEFGLSERRPGPGEGVELARIPDGVDAEAFARDLARDDRVAHAELDRPLFPQRVVPNDPALDRQWAPCLFGLPLAWDAWTGAELGGADASKSTIAIIDSGVDVDHPDLAARLVPGYDFCPVADARMSSCAESAPEPGGDAGSDWHGTHVTGIAAAIGDNATGIAGVAFGGVRVLPVKVFDDTGDITSVSSVACAIYWAVGSTDPAEICGATPNPHPASILNLSLGGPGTSAVLNAAVDAATERGALVFAASGNGSSRTAYGGILMPANAPSAWAVGSVNSNFERSSFSRFDALGGPTVDLMAPGGFRLPNGETIYSTDLAGDYAYLAGTSMATPYVAGVAALIWSREPTLEASEVAERLRTTAYAAPSWNANEYGAGVVCADRALGLATQCGLD